MLLHRASDQEKNLNLLESGSKTANDMIPLSSETLSRYSAATTSTSINTSINIILIVSANKLSLTD